MSHEECSDCAHLKEEISNILENISKATAEQVDAVRSGDQEKLMRLDKEVETMMGEKERNMGALLHHQRGHRS